MNLLRKAQCSDLFYRKSALRFQWRIDQRFQSQIECSESAIRAGQDSDSGGILAIFGERYDWTTGALHDGNEWGEVPCRTSCTSLAYPSLCIFNRSGSKGAFSFPGVTWDHFRCTVEPSPGFGLHDFKSLVGVPQMGV